MSYVLRILNNDEEDEKLSDDNCFAVVDKTDKLNISICGLNYFVAWFEHE